MSRKRKARPQYRSNFEGGLGARLEREGVPFQYEAETYTIYLQVPGAKCLKCDGKAIKESRYTPDFFLPSGGSQRAWVIEAKGKFTPRDRKRVLALLEYWPGLRGRFAMLFMRDNKLSKSSKTRYSDWCKANGIPYAIGWFNKEWLR